MMGVDWGDWAHRQPAGHRSNIIVFIVISHLDHRHLSFSRWCFGVEAKAGWYMQQRLVEAELTKFRFSLDWLFNGNPKLMMPVKILVSLNDWTDDDRIVGKEESACLQCFPHFKKLTHVPPCPMCLYVFFERGQKSGEFKNSIYKIFCWHIWVTRRVPVFRKCHRNK